MMKKFDELELMLQLFYSQKNIVDRINEEGRDIQEEYNKKGKEEKQQWEEKILNKMRLYNDCNSKVFLYSFLLSITGNYHWLEELLEMFVLVSEQDMPWKRRYQIYWQINSVLFNNAQYASQQTVKSKAMLNEIYSNIVREMKNVMKLDLRQIPVEERNKDFVIVTIDQFLSIQHGPTKTALDRCNTLIRKMSKQVMLINTAECMASDNATPWYRKILGNYHAGYLECNSIDYENVNIPFFQCDNNMPDVDTMEEIVELVQRLKPLYIVNIGGDSLLTDLCSELVPSITISTVPSKLATTTGQLQVIGKKLQSEDLQLLQAIGKEKEHVIEGRFTSSIPCKKNNISRDDIGAKEDEFLCAVVGGRLNKEITEDFVNMMLSISEKKIKFVFIGVFDEAYKQYCGKYKEFKDKAINAGFISNVSGYLAQCDLYVNPIRTGGGTSVIEAMCEGLPVVTPDFGDVALGAGQDFFIQDYEEMVKEIEHYYHDKEYYNEKSRLAKLRAAEMLNTDKAFCEIMEEAEKRLGIK